MLGQALSGHRGGVDVRASDGGEDWDRRRGAGYLGQRLTERLPGLLHEAGVKGRRDGEQAHLRPKRLGQLHGDQNSLLLAGQDEALRCVDVAQHHPLAGHAQQGVTLLLAADQAHHPVGWVVPGGDGLARLDPRSDHLEGGLQIPDPGQRQGRDLAEAVADHDVRSHAHGEQHPPHGHLDGEQGQLRPLQRGQLFGCPRILRVGVYRPEQIEAQRLAAQRVHPVQHVPEARVFAVQVLPHGDVVDALAGEAEGELLLFAPGGYPGKEHPLRLQRRDLVPSLQQLQRPGQLQAELILIVEGGGQAGGHRLALGDELGNGRQGCGPSQRGGQVIGILYQADKGAVRHGVVGPQGDAFSALSQHWRGAVANFIALSRGGRGGLRSLAVPGEHREIIGPTQAQRVHRAGVGAGGERRGALLRLDAIKDGQQLWPAVLQVPDGGGGLVSQGEQRAEHGRGAGPAIDVSDVRLDGGHLHGLAGPVGAQLGGQGAGLHQIGELVGGAVHIHHPDLFGLDRGLGQRVADGAAHGLLGGGDHALAVRLGGAAHGVNDTEDLVPVPAGVLKPLEQEEDPALADEEALSLGVEGPGDLTGHRAQGADPGGEDIAELLVEPAADHHLHLAIHELVDRRDQGSHPGGAGRVHGEVGALQV